MPTKKDILTSVGVKDDEQQNSDYQQLIIEDDKDPWAYWSFAACLCFVCNNLLIHYMIQTIGVQTIFYQSVCTICLCILYFISQSCRTGSCIPYYGLKDENGYNKTKIVGIILFALVYILFYAFAFLSKYYQQQSNVSVIVIVAIWCLTPFLIPFVEFVCFKIEWQFILGSLLLFIGVVLCCCSQEPVSLPHVSTTPNWLPIFYAVLTTLFLAIYTGITKHLTKEASDYDSLTLTCTAQAFINVLFIILFFCCSSLLDFNIKLLGMGLLSSVFNLAWLLCFTKALENGPKEQVTAILFMSQFVVIACKATTHSASLWIGFVLGIAGLTLFLPITRQNFIAVMEVCKKATGFVVLGLSILGGSSIGVVSDSIPIDSPFSKNVWRSWIILIYFFIPMLIENYYTWHKTSYRDLLRPKAYALLLLTCLCQCIWSSGLLYAASRTIQSHAYVISNLHGLYIVIIGFFSGAKILKGEVIGLFTAIIGCVMILVDPNAQKVDSRFTHTDIMIADAVNFFAALFGAFYFLLSAKNVKDIPICSLIFLMNIHFLIINALLASLNLLGSGPPFEISMNPKAGMFGFLNPECAFTAFVPYGIFCSIFGNAGYIVCLLFFSPLVVSSSFLLEPLVAQVLGSALGIDKTPGPLTIFGTLIIIFGISWIDKTMRQKRAAEGGVDDPVIDNHSMYISFRRYSQDFFSSSMVSQKEGIYGSYMSFVNKANNSQIQDFDTPIQLNVTVN